ncbi:MAG: hypothetical protein KVP17_001444 [Porospora cf. gigantea B]|nr:MAG: hypothetical protein KVP17_001444 [Porospora cf. gigantea B]
MLSASAKAREREQPVEEPVQENTEVLDMIIHRQLHVNRPPVNLYEQVEPVSPQSCDESEPPLTTESRGSTSVTTVRRVLKPAGSENSFMKAHWSAHEKALTRPVLGTTQGNTGKVQHVSGQTRVQSWLTTETHGAELRLKGAGLIAAGAGLPQPLVHVLTEEAGETLDGEVLNSLDVRHAAFSGSRLSHQPSLSEEASSPTRHGRSPDARRRLAEKKRSMVGRVLAVSSAKHA